MTKEYVKWMAKVWKANAERILDKQARQLMKFEYEDDCSSTIRKTRKEGA